MNEYDISETLYLTKYDKQTVKRNSYQASDLPDFENSESLSLTRYSKTTQSQNTISNHSLKTLCLTNLSKQTNIGQNQNQSERTLSLTIMTKLTIYKDVKDFGRKSF